MFLSFAAGVVVCMIAYPRLLPCKACAPCEKASPPVNVADVASRAAQIAVSKCPACPACPECQHKPCPACELSCPKIPECPSIAAAPAASQPDDAEVVARHRTKMLARDMVNIAECKPGQALAADALLCPAPARAPASPAASPARLLSPSHPPSLPHPPSRLPLPPTLLFSPAAACTGVPRRRPQPLARDRPEGNHALDDGPVRLGQDHHRRGAAPTPLQARPNPSPTLPRPFSELSPLQALERRLLYKLGKNVFRIDGDNLRTGLTKDLGFSPDDRAESARLSSGPTPAGHFHDTSWTCPVGPSGARRTWPPSSPRRVSSPWSPSSRPTAKIATPRAHCTRSRRRLREASTHRRTAAAPARSTRTR